MSTLLGLLNLRHLQRGWLRALLSLLGIIMGVAAFIFTPTLAVALTASLDQTTSDLGGSAALDVRAHATTLTADEIASLLDMVQTTDGVANAAPLYTGGGLLLGQSELLVFFGVDPARDRDFRAYTFDAGGWLDAPGQAVLTARYADEKGIALGDPLTLIGAGGVRSLTVVGLLSGATGTARLNGGDLVIMTTHDAAGLGAPFDSISILTDAPDAVRAALTARLPANAVVDTPAARQNAASQFTILSSMLISVISVMIMILGATLIFNTMNVAVAERRREIGILRAFGMERRRLTRLYVLEAAALGVVGTLIGIALGYVMVKLGGSAKLLPQEFLGSSPLRSQAALTVPTWLTPLAFAFGIGISALAGYLPGRAAARVDPVEAMAGVRADSGRMAFPVRQMIIAFVLFGGLLVMRMALLSGTLNVPPLIAAQFGTNGVFISIFIGLLLLAPLLIALSRFLPPLLARMFGVTGMIAAGNLTRRPKRVLATTMLLMFGVAFSQFIASSNFGYTAYTDRWSRGENVGDLTVSGAGSNPFTPLIAIPDDVIAGIAARADVSGLIAESLATFEQAGTRYSVRAVDLAAFRAAGGAFIWNDGDEATAYDRLMDADRPALLLNTGFAAMGAGLKPGGLLTLETPTGETTFEIVGTALGGISVDAISMVLDRAVYARLWGDSEIDRLSVQLTPAADASAVRRDLLRAYATRGVVTFDSAEMIAAFGARLASIANVSSLLSSLFVVIIVAGLISTFTVFVLDRRREIGVLRALGMTRGQVARGMVLEALLMLLMAIIVGLPIALFANTMQQLSLQRVMGIYFDFAPSEIAATLLLTLILVIASVWLPAQAAARTDPLMAMRYE